MLQLAAYTWVSLRNRFDEVRKNNAGYSSETVIVTALLAGLAIAVITIIAFKVTGAANDVKTK